MSNIQGFLLPSTALELGGFYLCSTHVDSYLITGLRNLELTRLEF